MRKNKFIFIILLVSLVFGACEKPDKLWDLPPAGAETVASVNMGPNYDNAIFFNLKTGAKETRNIYSWHLGFASGVSENHIIMNGGNEVQVHATTDTTFSASYTAGPSTEWLWDNPNGKPDSTAFAGWYDSTASMSRNLVYILDLGSKAVIRYRKIKILAVSASSFTIRYANLDGNDEQVLEIVKNANTNFVYLNLETHTTVAFEPDQMAWDLIFTRYRHIYYDMTPITPYYVNGALINTKSVQVKEAIGFTFESVDLEKASQLMLTRNEDEIGYDWKFYDLNGTGKYVVDSKRVFVIKDRDGYLYKLRFIDFYDETGTKGVPKFAYQRL